MPLRTSLKKAALRSLRAAGAMSASARFRRGNTLVILCYHGISLRDEHQWAPGLYIPPALFRERLAFLKSWGANVLPLGEALARLRAGTLPPRSVVLTFDDGFRDFHRHALPALRDFGFPCTLYLTTHYMHYRLPVFNLALSYLLWKTDPLRFGSRDARDAELARYLSRAEQDGLDTQQKDAVLRHLAENSGMNYDALLEDQLFQIMTPDEVADLAAEGIDIQLHTHRHRTPANHELFVREIYDNAREIQAITGRQPVHFCYPSGVTNPDFLPWLRECGVESATTCVHSLVHPDTEPLMTPRYLDACGVTPLDFEAWLSGLR